MSKNPYVWIRNSHGRNVWVPRERAEYLERMEGAVILGDSPYDEVERARHAAKAKAEADALVVSESVPDMPTWPEMSAAEVKDALFAASDETVIGWFEDIGVPMFPDVDPLDAPQATPITIRNFLYEHITGLDPFGTQVIDGDVSPTPELDDTDEDDEPGEHVAIADMSYQELRSECKALGLDATGKAADMVERLTEYHKE